MRGITLIADGWQAVLHPQGASLLELRDPSGFNWIPDPPETGRHLFGAVAGPWANRLDPGPWGLTANEGKLHLHGGFRGTDLREWEVLSRSERKLSFLLDWPEGDEGYPNIQMQVTYELMPGVVEWELKAESSRPIPLNLVQHGYWNLGAPTIDDHTLQISAWAMRAPGPDGMTAPPDLENFFARSAPLQGTWDHTFLLHHGEQNRVETSAVLHYGPRTMEVFTTSPSLHLYTGHFLPRPRSGVCLECGLPPGRWGMGVPSTMYFSRTRHVFYSHYN